jgi:6-phosphogluconate dehydrogenase
MRANGCDIGMVGLGVMGRNFALNMADHGFGVAGHDLDPAKVRLLHEEGKGLDVHGADEAEAFLALLAKPRTIMMLVPAGKPVDSVVNDLLPRLDRGDLLIDGGNSHFTDTDVRAKMLADKGILFMGVGVSGGESGARHGPSLMAGGPEEAWKRVKPIFEACAARVDGDPCVAYLGKGSAGHYVKMVHNGIEYALMELIAETYDFMKRGLDLNDDELAQVYDRWNRGDLKSFLVEIASQIFVRVDERTGKRLVDVILDRAAQLGTGMWTSQDAMQLQVPVPTIDAAVSMRDLSSYKTERIREAKVLHGPDGACAGCDREEMISRLEGSLYFGTIMTFSQGMALLSAALQRYGYGYTLEDVARIWRGGCIIRAAVLEDVREAYRAHPKLPNLLMSPPFMKKAEARQEDLRTVVCAAAQLGIPAPAMMASLAWFDAHRSAWLPANLIQAQRDWFGAHTYERVDDKGTFHTVWSAP